MKEFEAFGKIPRLSRDCTVTEKIDGTNGCIYINTDYHLADDPEHTRIDDGEFLIGSRSRWITPGKSTDNMGFARWAYEHKDELIAGLGPGLHFGEWWGLGIQRHYGLMEKRFSLFNTHRWSDPAVRPACCGVVPALYQGPFDTVAIEMVLSDLQRVGSQVAPGFMKPEGVVIYHHASKGMFKKTIEKDEKPKGSKEE